MQHRFFAGGRERAVTLAIARIHAPAAPGHHAFAIEHVVDIEIHGPAPREGPARPEVELVEARQDDHVGDVAGALAHVFPRQVGEEAGRPVAERGVENEVGVVVGGLARKIEVEVVVAAVGTGLKDFPDRALRFLGGEDGAQAEAFRERDAAFQLQAVGGDDVVDWIRIVGRDAIGLERLGIAVDIAEPAPKRRGGEVEAALFPTVAQLPLFDGLWATFQVVEPENRIVAAEETVVGRFFAVGVAEIKRIVVIDDEVARDGPREAADVFVEIPFRVRVRDREAVVGHRERVSVGAAIGRVPVAAGVLGSRLVIAFDHVILAANTPVDAPARMDVPLVAEEIRELSRDALVPGVTDAEGGETVVVRELHRSSIPALDRGERGRRCAGGGSVGGRGNPGDGERLRLLGEGRGRAAAAGLAIGDAGVAEVAATGKRHVAKALGHRKLLHDFIHVLVGDAAGVGPEGAGHDLSVGQVGEADDLAGVGERVGVDGVIAVGRNLGEHGAGPPV